jgi:hypothetical protein
MSKLSIISNPLDISDFDANSDEFGTSDVFDGDNASQLAFGASVFEPRGAEADPVGSAGPPAAEGVASPGLTSGVTPLTAVQATSFTTTTNSAVLSAIAAQQASLMGSIDAGALISQSEVKGSICYSSMLSILQSEASGGMNLTKFDTLTDIAAELNAKGGVKTSAYVQQITDDVVDGNPANAYWNGGSSNPTALGDLTASSSQTQVDELIGKWFLGTDLPSTSLVAAGDGNPPVSYEATSLPLYGPSGAPVYTDVNQGYVGDCYFVASLAETALKDPSAIENMISNNGNGTYSVDFQVNGKSDYVTVNDELPVNVDGPLWADGSDLEFANGSTAWVPLIEKAYAELHEQFTPTGDAYQAMSGGNANALTEITGQPVTFYAMSGMSTSALKSLASTLGSQFASGSEVLVETPGGADNGNLIADHEFEVTGINASKGTVSLQNPWNNAVNQSGLAMSFTETMSQLAADNCWIASSSPSKT